MSLTRRPNRPNLTLHLSPTLSFRRFLPSSSTTPITPLASIPEHDYSLDFISHGVPESLNLGVETTPQTPTPGSASASAYGTGTATPLSGSAPGWRNLKRVSPTGAGFPRRLSASVGGVKAGVFRKERVDLDCGICFEPCTSQNPHRTLCCRTLFCYDHIADWLSSSSSSSSESGGASRCPSCDAPCELGNGSVVPVFPSPTRTRTELEVNPNALSLPLQKVPPPENERDDEVEACSPSTSTSTTSTTSTNSAYTPSISTTSTSPSLPSLSPTSPTSPHSKHNRSSSGIGRQSKGRSRNSSHLNVYAWPWEWEWDFESYPSWPGTPTGTTPMGSRSMHTDVEGVRECYGYVDADGHSYPFRDGYEDQNQNENPDVDTEREEYDTVTSPPEMSGPTSTMKRETILHLAMALKILGKVLSVVSLVVVFAAVLSGGGGGGR